MEQCPAERIIESMMKACALNNEDNGCSSTIHSVRSMLLFRLCGGVHVLLKQLTKHYHELLVSLPMSDPPKLTESIILQTLQLLHDFSSNYDFSYEFASIGGHTLLKKLLLIDSPTIVELTEDIIGTITSTGCVFPTTTMRIMSDDDVREGLMLMPTIHKFRDDESIFHVFLRKAPQRMYGSTHERVVGYVLWNSAVILSRWLVTNEKILVRNKSVLEIGAGLGLCGLVAARYASSMSLSDWTNELLVNLDVNLGLNSGSELINGECGSVLPTCACDVRHLDWSKLPHIQQHDQDNNGDDMSTLVTLGENNGLEGIEQKGIIEEDTVNEGISWSDEVQEKPTFLPLEKSRLYDVIIGSDIVYCREDAVNVPNVLWHHLAPLGWFLMVQPQPQHRYGSDHCITELKRAGFEVYSRPIAHSHSTSPAVCDSSVPRSWHYENDENLAVDGSNSCSNFRSSRQCFIDSLVVNDDELVHGLDEHDFCSWLLILAHKKSTAVVVV